MKYPLTSERIKQAMNQKGIIAQELADRSGVSKSSISQYVNGSHAPSNISAGLLGKVLGVDPAWLMGFSSASVSDLDDLEQQLLTRFRKLNSSGKVKVLEQIDDMIGLPKYTNRKSSASAAG